MAEIAKVAVLEDFMRCHFCVYCGSIVDGCSRYGIRLQFCCRRCSATQPEEVCISQAMSRFKCAAKDLDVLDSRDRSANRRFKYRKYIRVEAEYLGRLRSGKEMWEARQKRKATQEALVQKRIRLEHQTGIQVTSVRRDLRPFVFGDYLGKHRNTRIQRNTVHSRLKAHRRAAQLVDTCRTDPLTALDFCVAYPQGGTEEFLDLKERVQKVFRLMGDRILCKVPRNELSKLVDTPLADVYREFMKRDLSKLVRHCLRQKVGEQVAYQIMKHEDCRRRLQHGGEEEEVAMQLLEVWNEKNKSKNKRKERTVEITSSQRPLKRTMRSYHFLQLNHN